MRPYAWNNGFVEAWKEFIRTLLVGNERCNVFKFRNAQIVAWLANYVPRPPAFVNKVSLEHSHALSLT